MLDHLFKTTNSKTHEFYAIGDTHQCFDEYKSLLKVCRQDAIDRNKIPVIVQLGDVIDRGPDFLNSVLMDSADYQLMGNHEFYFLQEFYGVRICRSQSRFVTHESFKKLPPELKCKVIKLLQTRLPFLSVLDLQTGYTYLFSHSPIKDFENQEWKGKDEIHHRNLGHFIHNGATTDLSKLESSDEKIMSIHGHQSWKYIDITEQIVIQSKFRKRVYNLDSGCVYGNHLTAMRVFDQFVFTVKSSVKVEKEIFNNKP
jgi:hypothetical protein